MLRFLAHYLGGAFMRAAVKQPSRAVVDIELARRLRAGAELRRSAVRTATYNPKQFRGYRGSDGR